MYVANTAAHQIIQVRVKTGSADTPWIFITGINAQDEIVLINKTGKVIPKLGRLRRSRRASRKGRCFSLAT